MPSVVVLPFQTLTAGEDARLSAAGVTEDVIFRLMRLPDLRLFSLNPGFSQADIAAATLGRDLGVRYVVARKPTQL